LLDLTFNGENENVWLLPILNFKAWFLITGKTSSLSHYYGIIKAYHEFRRCY